MRSRSRRNKTQERWGNGQNLKGNKIDNKVWWDEWVCVCLIEIRTNWRRIMETGMEEGDDKMSNERREGRECTGHSKHFLPTTQKKTQHMNITRWSTPKSD